MPFIQLKTTKELNTVTKETLNTELLTITKQCLGKGENWVMTSFEENASMYFQGSSEDIAYVEVKAYGEPSKAGTNKMTAQVCQLMEKELQIPANRVYVSYFSTNHWGWNGENF